MTPETIEALSSCAQYHDAQAAGFDPDAGIPGLLTEEQAQPLRSVAGMHRRYAAACRTAISSALRPPTPERDSD